MVPDLINKWAWTVAVPAIYIFFALQACTSLLSIEANMDRPRQWEVFRDPTQDPPTPSPSSSSGSASSGWSRSSIPSQPPPVYSPPRTGPPSYSSGQSSNGSPAPLHSWVSPRASGDDITDYRRGSDDATNQLGIKSRPNDKKRPLADVKPAIFKKPAVLKKPTVFEKPQPLPVRPNPKIPVAPIPVITRRPRRRPTGFCLYRANTKACWVTTCVVCLIVLIVVIVPPVVILSKKPG